MNRDRMLAAAISQRDPWDILIIGGGATGVGIAVDSATRGYRTLLLEQSDFGKGTSSRSTKLVHGGVRYLEQGNISLVMEALKERGALRANAPHLVKALTFIVPNYRWWQTPFYGIGLKAYNLLAGKYRFGPSRILSREETLRRLPTIRTKGLRGGVVYHDGQFDDARLLISLVATAAEHGAILLNYAPVTQLLRGGDGFINGVMFTDAETAAAHHARAKVVINAAGPWCDQIRRLADPGAEPMLAPSQGAHLVLDRSFLPGDCAIMVPHTSDGRVLFAIPWHGHTLVGTTETPIDGAPLDPIPQEREIDFILETASLYFARKPTRADILSTFAGIRPLVGSVPGARASALSRDHTIHIDGAGLLTIAGGKWTTYRRMAQDCVDQAATLAKLPDVPCATKSLRIHGYLQDSSGLGRLEIYGADGARIAELARQEGLSGGLDPALPYAGAEVVWAIRHEMARTIEDVLARRTRALFLNARAALRMAPRVAQLFAQELNRDQSWQETQVAAFERLARGYLPQSVAK
jgi:glycerol-3-phosphate dehydrogenase